MNRKIRALVGLIVCGLAAFSNSTFAQGTAFSYQGQLSSSGGPANGHYDLAFSLYAGSTGGNPVTPAITNLDTPVTNGLFTVALNFGSGIFTGGIYWLEIAVETNGGTGFVTLAPRQQVTPAPYAMYAANAGTAAVAESVAAANISGPIALTQLAGNVITNAQNNVTLSGAFNGNGAGLTNLNASNLTNGTVADARLSTNVDLLNANQTLSGGKTFDNQVNVATGNNTALFVQSTVTGDFHSPSAYIENDSVAANAGPALRLLANGPSPNGVLSVSGQTSGVIAAFGNANSFVSQLDINGNWTGNSFSGAGSNLTALNASNLTNGTVADARLSTNVDLLNANQTLTGQKTFNSFVNINGSGSGALNVQDAVTGDFHSPVAYIQNTSGAASASPALRLLANGPSPNGVLSVSGQSSGVIAAFGNANSFVSQLDINGNWTGTSFSGVGSNLTALNASNLTSGTVADARLSTNVDLLNANQTLSGQKTFNSFVNINGSSSGALNAQGAVTGDFHFPVVNIQNSSFATNASPALRLLTSGASPNGVLSVSGQTSGLIAAFGNANSFVSQLDINGNWTANSYSGNGSALANVNAITLGGNDLSSVSGEKGLSLGTNIFLNSNPVYLRNDMNHGLAYNGGGITNFPSASVQPDGPVLWGYTGGALGTLNGGAQADLSWNNSGVSVAGTLGVSGAVTAGSLSTPGNLAVNNITASGNLSANNTPGVNWNQITDPEPGYPNSINIPNNGAAQILSCGNLKPAVGYFVIIATAEIYNNGNSTLMTLYDTTSGTPQYLTEGWGWANGSQWSTSSITYIVPITSPGGYENFAVSVYAYGNNSAVGARNMTVMYFPRQNN